MKTKFANWRERRSLIGKWLPLLIGILFLVGLAQQSLIEINAQVDKSVITIGDRVTYTLEIIHDKNLKIQQPGPGANLGQFEIKDYRILEPREVNGKIFERFEYVISVFDTGRFVIPPFPVAFATSDTAKNYQIIKSDPVEIYVKSILKSADAKLKDIKPPLEIPFDYWRLLRWILGGLLLILLLAGGYYYYRKRKQGEPLFRKEVIRPAHEVALERLSALKQSSLLQEKQYKTFFIELSNIVRDYIEHRYFVKAMEETTAEILESLRELELNGDSLQKLQNVLQISDLVKFAKFLPDEEEIQTAFQNVESFISETKLEFETVEVTEPVQESEDLKNPELTDEANGKSM